jgi:hypothetical protein
MKAVLHALNTRFYTILLSVFIILMRTDNHFAATLASFIPATFAVMIFGAPSLFLSAISLWFLTKLTIHPIVKAILWFIIAAIALILNILLILSRNTLDLNDLFHSSLEVVNQFSPAFIALLAIIITRFRAFRRLMALYQGGEITSN